MIYHLLIVAWRNILRNKFYSILLLLGFTIGISASMILISYTYHELSYDNFHEKKERVFLVGVETFDGNEQIKSGWTAPPTGPAFKEHFPEVENFTRLCFWFDEVLVQKDARQFVEKKVIGADSSVFDIFSISFIEGNPATALKEPNSIVVSENIAKKHFPGKSPLGETLKFDQFFSECIITGVVENYPDNSHFDFEILVSLSSLNNIGFDFENSWGNHTFSTYVLLNPNTDTRALEAKFPEFHKSMMEPIYLSKLNKTYDELYSDGSRYNYYLTPLSDVHLSTLIFPRNEGKKVMAYALGVVGIIIILMVCINYLNLNIALGMKRIKETGIRKISGSSRFLIINQFLTESFIIILSSLILALVAVELMLPYFNNFTGKNLSFNYTDPLFLLILLGGALFMAKLSGYYPAFIVSSFKPSNALKSNHNLSGSNKSLGSFLIIFQFSMCLFMIISTAIIFKQINYMGTMNTGFDKEQVLVLKRPMGLGNNFQAFKDNLLKNSDIKSLSYANTFPGKGFDGNGQHFLGNPAEEWHTIMPLMGDKDLIQTLGIKLADGRAFSENDRNKALLNQSAVTKYNLENPLEKIIDNGTKGKVEVEVIGIVENFNFQSFHNQIEPLVIFQYDEERLWEMNYALIKLSGQNLPATINFIKNEWDQLSNNYLFEYSFLDQEFQKIFEKEQITSKVFTAFSIVAIIIACLGLLGIAALFAANRKKEIGIRKVNGAGILQILALLNTQFIKWLVFAFIITTPLAWYAVNLWLGNFAYKTNISWWIFALAGILTFLMTLMIVSWQSYKSAVANPIESLKSE